MAQSEITIAGKIEFRPEPGDGTICYECGDAAWLTQWRVVFACNFGDMDTEIVLCNGCGDGAIE